MNQIDRSPVLVFCQTMSAWPSALKSPVLVFCQSIRIAGAVRAEALAWENGAAAGRPTLNDPAGGLLTLIPPAAGPYMLMWLAAGTASVLFFALGAVGGESVQERSPTAEASAKKTVSRVGVRIDVFRMGRLP